MDLAEILSVRKNLNFTMDMCGARKMCIFNKTAIIFEAVSGGDDFVAFSKTTDHAKLAEDFSDNLKDVKKTLVFQKILKKYGQ